MRSSAHLILGRLHVCTGADDAAHEVGRDAGRNLPTVISRSESGVVRMTAVVTVCLHDFEDLWCTAAVCSHWLSGHVPHAWCWAYCE